MQIKKGEIITLMSGVYGSRHRPMVAVQDFDLTAVATDITAGMTRVDREWEIGLLDEILEARGFLQPLPNRQLCFDYWSDNLVVEEAPFEPLWFNDQ